MTHSVLGKPFSARSSFHRSPQQGQPGQYRVSLLKTFKDGFYPAIDFLPDGIIVATTYANHRQEDIGCSIVSGFQGLELTGQKKTKELP